MPRFIQGEQRKSQGQIALRLVDKQHFGWSPVSQLLAGDPRNKFGIAERREPDKADAVREASAQFWRDVQSQLNLTNPSWTSRDQLAHARADEPQPLALTPTKESMLLPPSALAQTNLQSRILPQGL